jgi:multidrug efflux pump subunit AcrA (membrane-fusion protein)
MELAMTPEREAELFASLKFLVDAVGRMDAEQRCQAEALRRQGDEQGRQGDEQRRQADEQRRQADEQRRQADEQRRQADEQRRQADEQRRQAEILAEIRGRITDMPHASDFYELRGRVEEISRHLPTTLAYVPPQRKAGA